MDSPITSAEKLAVIAQIFQNTSDAMVVVDTSKRIVLVNRHAELMFGVGSDEIEGRIVNDLLPMERREVHDEHLNGYIGEPKPRAMGATLDLKACRLDSGTEFPVSIELSPFSTATSVYTLATIRRVEK